LRASKAIAASAAAVGSILLAAGCSSSSSSSTSTAAASSSMSAGASAGASVNPATATSAAAFGSMNGLIAAAKKEGQLNVITLPSNWANYGAIMKAFTAKYGIHITDANPEGSSANEISAINELKGKSSAPDVVDVGSSFAVSGDASRLWAPYKVATWNDIPAAAKQANGDYYADYGGYVAIGYDPSRVKTPPTSFKSLLNPIYHNQVAIDGDPTQTGSAFAAVYAAALANGGSLSDIAPGIAYFKSLKAAGNFVPTEGTPATVQSGATPILIWWDYLLASEVAPVVKGFKVVIPSDAQYAGYYDQAISATAPDPAAARLWEEFLYSAQGQNLFLGGQTRPIEMSAMIANGTIDKTGALDLPTTAQNTAAENVVAQQWPTVSS
jgi:putative spermidine/putrescine transport system substrate-binding protein